MRDRHIYYQDGTGWQDADEVHKYPAYAGHGEGFNNPTMERVANVGPLPRGLYTMGPIVTSDKRFGPSYIPLIPHPTNEMFGRSGFLVHWDTAEHNHEASHGCVVLISGANLQVINASPTRLLEVK